jgi:LPXTG-site transpeptidase (sortase) family protein
VVVDPAIVKSGDPSTASVGQNVTFTFTVTNNGNAAATNVVVSDTVSSFLDIVTVTTTRGTASFSGRTATFNIGTVNPGEVITLTIVTRVNNTANTTQDIENTGTLTHTSNNLPASESSNTVTIRIVGQITLPNTGEDPTALDQTSTDWLLWLVNLLIALVGLGLMVFGGYRWYEIGRYNRRLKAEQDEGEEKRKPRPNTGPAYMAIGAALLMFFFTCSAATWAWRTGNDRISQPTALISVLATKAAEQLPPPSLVIIPTSTPEPDEALPDYDLPTPPPVADDFVLQVPPSNNGTPQPQATSTPVPVYDGPDTSQVTRIIIPSRNVDAEVVYIPFDGLTWSLTGLRQQVAWLGNTSWPGLGSNTALAGHVVLRGGKLGPFYYIEKIKPGEEIIVYTERNIYTYTVRERRVVAPTDMYVLDPTDSPQLTLITCTAWDAEAKTYTQRQVVFADLVNVGPITLGIAP